MKLFIVQAENGGEPESYTLGVFDNEEKAKELAERHLIPEGLTDDQIMDLIDEADDEGRCLYEYAWYSEVELNTAVMLCNR